MRMISLAPNKNRNLSSSVGSKTLRYPTTGASTLGDVNDTRKKRNKKAAPARGSSTPFELTVEITEETLGW